MAWCPGVSFDYGDFLCDTERKASFIVVYIHFLWTSTLFSSPYNRAAPGESPQVLGKDNTGVCSLENPALVLTSTVIEAESERFDGLPLAVDQSIHVLNLPGNHFLFPLIMADSISEADKVSQSSSCGKRS